MRHFHFLTWNSWLSSHGVLWRRWDLASTYIQRLMFYIRCVYAAWPMVETSAQDTCCCFYWLFSCPPCCQIPGVYITFEDWDCFFFFLQMLHCSLSLYSRTRIPFNYNLKVKTLSLSLAVCAVTKLRHFGIRSHRNSVWLRVLLWKPP